MSLSYLPAGRTGFVPRPCGFGAALLGLDPVTTRTSAADGIVATRQERDLLRGDLTVVRADGALLPGIVGSSLPESEWDLLELGDPDDHPELAAALAVVRALGREGAVGVLLTGPVSLAEHVAGGPVDEDDEELVDVCGLVVCDAAKAVLHAGGHVVLEEQRAPSSAELALCSPLLKLLAHHRSPALALVHRGDAGALAAQEGVAVTVTDGALPAGAEAWVTPPGAPVLSPRVAADASPERVQELVRGFRMAASA